MRAGICAGAYCGKLDYKADCVKRPDLCWCQAAFLVRMAHVGHPLTQTPILPPTPRHQAVTPQLPIPACVANESTYHRVGSSENRELSQAHLPSSTGLSISIQLELHLLTWEPILQQVKCRIFQVMAHLLRAASCSLKVFPRG